MRIHFFILSLFVFTLAGCTETELAAHVAKSAMPPPKNEGNFKVGKPYKVQGKWYTPQETYNFTETGIASWYGDEFNGKPTANGEIFNMNELTAAHRTLQMPSLVRVTNLDNGRSVIVRVNDRGPFKRGRVMDVSKRAAELLGFKNQGTAKVKLQLLSEESQKVAMSARRGESTRGVELAMNDRSSQPVLTHVSQQATAAPISGHFSQQGNFMPDPVVKQMPVTPTNIYVQTGSFSQQDNAARLAQTMQQYGNAQIYPAVVNGQQFYRVRVGPLASVEAADSTLAKLVTNGHAEAIIIVD